MKLLTFKPLKPFFFGGRINFSNDNYVYSRYFPQTTQLLGAIRLYIGEKKGFIKVYKNGRYSKEPEKLKKLIGDAKPENFSENDNLGCIKYLSPMFLISKNKENFYYPTPFDYYIYDNEYGIFELKKLQSSYYFKHYDAKKGITQYLGDKSFWDGYIKNKPTKAISFNDVFEKVTQVGIALENKSVKDEKFYYKVSYNLKEDFLFGCIIDCDEIEDGEIQIGADGSMFKLSVEEFNFKSPLFDALIKNKKILEDKSVALSDSFGDVRKFKGPAIVKSEDFRMIKYKKEGKIYTFGGKTEYKKLIKRGSVFYGDVNFNATGAYKKISFNKFIRRKDV
jgi:hypothetical protein